LDTSGLEAQVKRVSEALERSDFRAAQMKKLEGSGFYRAELGRKDRLLVQLRKYRGEMVALQLEVIRNHAYESSRFLGGAQVDESRIVEADAAAIDVAALAELPHLPAQARSFRFLDKVLVWDDAQAGAFQARTPLVLIGSAGSGKTALVLEKLKEATGDVLYATLSPYLAEHARRMYHAQGFARDDQEVDFLSFREFLETLQVPEGREATYADFLGWFRRHARSAPELDAHRLQEEFKGVLTGFPVDRPWLEREAYLGLGVRQSIFPEDLRPKVYDLFEKYLAFLAEARLFEPNILAHGHLGACQGRYDLVAVDEVQDLTNVQLALLLKTLRRPGNFMLCGDSNQIVHPNFFSWAHLKSFFFEHGDLAARDITRILQANYRNAPQVTDLANRLLRLKQRRFGSIDRESHYLVESAGATTGEVVFLRDTEAVRRELDAKTSRSAQFAVIVPRDEDKAEAMVRFKTPLLFSIHEAKGLEYENVILLNFTSSQRAIHREIAADLTAADLEGELSYGRARDKSDKSLETYKFFVNSLYVAMTRAVKNLYWIEQDVAHPFLALLGFGSADGPLGLREQRSTAEEWEREARRLELQGKLEQAQAIQKTLLRHRPVPWQVLDAAGLAEAVPKALPPRSVSAKQRDRLFEWALLGSEPMTLGALAAHGFPDPVTAMRQRDRVLAKATAAYRGAQNRELWREVEAHGLGFRNPHNLTPLMLAARVGHVALVQALLERGADPSLVDTRGWTAFQHALDEAWRRPESARQSLPAMARLLAPESLSLESEGRLLKLDQRQGETLMVQVFMVLQPWAMPLDEEADWPGLTAQGLTKLFQELPPEVLPAYRTQRPYISALLARHERGRDKPGSRPLFWRTQRGVYVLDPKLRMRMGEGFQPVYDLLFPPALRPYAPAAFQDFLERPEAFVTPRERSLIALRAKREAERVANEARWERWRVEDAQWKEERAWENAAREAARLARIARAEAARQKKEAAMRRMAESAVPLLPIEDEGSAPSPGAATPPAASDLPRA
jgi:hypothetical protein